MVKQPDLAEEPSGAGRSADASAAGGTGCGCACCAGRRRIVQHILHQAGLACASIAHHKEFKVAMGLRSEIVGTEAPVRKGGRRDGPAVGAGVVRGHWAKNRRGDRARRQERGCARHAQARLLVARTVLLATQ